MAEDYCMFGQSHCFNAWSTDSVSSYFYLMAFFVALFVGIHRSTLKEHGHDSMLLPARRIGWFPTLLMFSFLSRATWLQLRDMHAFEYKLSNSTYAHMKLDVPFLHSKIDIYPIGVTLPGKISTLLYFSAFTILVRFWDEMIQNHENESKKSTSAASTAAAVNDHSRTSKRSKHIFVIVNVWMYVAEFGLISMKFAFIPLVFSSMLKQTFAPRFKSFLFSVDYVVVALFFFALSVVLARCAMKLRRILQSIEFSCISRLIETRITVIAIICSLLFFFRSILFFLSPATDDLDPHSSDPWFFYTIPEIIPGVTVLLMMKVKKAESIDEKSGTIKSEYLPLLDNQSTLDRSPFEGNEIHI